eukprot:253121_1
MYSDSALFRNRPLYIRDGHYMLGDGIFRFFEPPMLTRYCNRAVLSIEQEAYNYTHSECRVLIENVIGRVKVLFPVLLKPWQLERTKLNQFLPAMFIKTNIITIYQSPFRS